ncbi:hypothetical protein VNO80_15680 [Phaseolus coccineus]|uniref:Uncharacterized protein n=1 Tax=Phaseolus coccineus TaxID=3886 RepID=A0AAN9MP58_PHACN
MFFLWCSSSSFFLLLSSSHNLPLALLGLSQIGLKWLGFCIKTRIAPGERDSIWNSKFQYQSFVEGFNGAIEQFKVVQPDMDTSVFDPFKSVVDGQIVDDE